MIIAKNDEVRRSKIWRFVMIGSSIVIVLIAVYLLTKLFTTNPLSGAWSSEDDSYTLKIRGGDVLQLEIADLAEDRPVDVSMSYQIDTNAKVLSIEVSEDQIETALEKADRTCSKADLEHALDRFETSFNYSVDREELTLTEREYGEQMTFIKK